MTLVDTNVIVDLTSEDPRWKQWSLEALTDAFTRGPVLVNEVVFAELCSRYERQTALDEYLDDLGLTFQRVPRPALFLAGQAYAAYRRVGGPKLNVLADFFIGAHAQEL